jgi:hypothetical protein
VSQVPPPSYPGQQSYQSPPPGAAKTNGWAIGSLICGILLCIPGITGLLAIIFGVVGIKKSNEPQGSGKGLAIAGIALGIIGILGWVGFGGLSYWGYQKAKELVFAPTQVVGGSFLNSLASGNLTEAQTYTTGTMSQTDLAALRTKLQGLGKFKDFQLTQFNNRQQRGGSTELRLEIGGTANFENGSRSFSATVVSDVNSPASLKFESFELE